MKGARIRAATGATSFRPGPTGDAGRIGSRRSYHCDMPAPWALVLMQVAATPAEPPPVAAPPAASQPVAPQPVAPQPMAPPVAQPMPPMYTPPYIAPTYGPPDYEALDRQFGDRYLEPRGKGLRISGGVTVAVGAPLLLASIACLLTGAIESDSGEQDSARFLLLTAAGLGVAGLVGTGAGAAMLVIGKARKRRYHAWLLQQSQRPPPRLEWRPAAILGPQRAGLALTLRF